jgi:hypothetical protein
MLILTLACVLASVGSASAATRRVPEDVPTIQAALDASASGDRVIVGPGTWAENLDFGGKNVTLESANGPAVTIIQAPGGIAVSIGPDGALVGFTVTGADTAFDTLIEVNGAGTRIARNVIRDNRQDFGELGAGIRGNGASPVIDGNVFRGHNCDSQFLSGVVAFVNVSSPVIVNNVCEDNSCRAINMTLPSEAAPRVINNTIILNLVGIRVDRRIGTASQIHRNNIEVANTVGLQVDFGSEGENPVWQHNLVHANETDYSGLVDPTGTDGNLSADPQFVDVVAGDYRLEPGSPAIDAGALVLVPPTDFDGVPRSRDGNGDGVDVFDIGAFEAGRAITISPRPAPTFARNWSTLSSSPKGLARWSAVR